MPTYEYLCTGCGSTTELRASLAAKEAGLSPRCRACGSGEVRRTFSTVAVVGASSRAAQGQAQAPAGGCCGGGCGC